MLFYLSLIVFINLKGKTSDNCFASDEMSLRFNCTFYIICSKLFHRICTGKTDATFESCSTL